MRTTERGNGALVILGVVCLLGGIVALALVLTDSMNQAEAGTAKKLAGIGIGVGFAAIMGGFMLKKRP